MFLFSSLIILIHGFYMGVLCAVLKSFGDLNVFLGFSAVCRNATLRCITLIYKVHVTVNICTKFRVKKCKDLGTLKLFLGEKA